MTKKKLDRSVSVEELPRCGDRKQTGEIEAMEEKKNGGGSSGSGPGANLPMQKIKNMMKSNERCAAESPRRAPSQPAPEVACAVPVERPSLDSPGLPDLSAGLRAAPVPGFLPRSCHRTLGLRHTEALARRRLPCVGRGVRSAPASDAYGHRSRVCSVSD